MSIVLTANGRTVMTMNHDYAHCLAADSRCPKDCFRFQLTAELSKMWYPFPVTWSNFEGSKECKRTRKDGDHEKAD